MFRFDESDPRYLIAYEEKHEHSVAPYQELMRRWALRAERGEAFGVVLVNADHTHEEGDDHDDHERDVAFEEAFTRLLNDFRRDHKPIAEQSTVGYVRILPPGWMSEQMAANPDFIDEMRVHHERTSRYLFGVPGGVFLTVGEAKAWIDSQIAGFMPPERKADDTAPPSNRRVGLFYGSTTGVTEMAALAVAQAWAERGMAPITALNIGVVKDLAHLLDYDCLILGVPTWNVGKLQDDWDIAFPQLDALDFTGKPIALFGIGDQYNYPDNYLDAMGTLGAKLVERGATLVGGWNDGLYEFAASTAFIDGRFMGLALDEVFQAEHTDRRIHQWVEQLTHEFAMQPETVTGA